MTDPLLPSKPGSKKNRVVMLILLSILLVGSSLFLTNTKDSDVIIVTFPSGAEINAEVADTPEKLLFGLAFREALPADSGMLYIFATSDRHRMWTKGFKIPVDIIWADGSRRVVHLAEDAQPCAQDPCPYYGPPPENARYVIETVAGFVKREQLVRGAELKFTLRL